MKVTDLNADHLFEHVHIRARNWTVSGVLRSVSHDSDAIVQANFIGDERLIRGRTRVHLKVGPADLTATGDEDVTLTEQPTS